VHSFTHARVQSHTCLYMHTCARARAHSIPIMHFHTPSHHSFSLHEHEEARRARVRICAAERVRNSKQSKLSPKRNRFSHLQQRITERPTVSRILYSEFQESSCDGVSQRLESCRLKTRLLYVGFPVYTPKVTRPHKM